MTVTAALPHHAPSQSRQFVPFPVSFLRHGDARHKDGVRHLWYDTTPATCSLYPQAVDPMFFVHHLRRWPGPGQHLNKPSYESHIMWNNAYLMLIRQFRTCEQSGTQGIGGRKGDRFPGKLFDGLNGTIFENHKNAM